MSEENLKTMNNTARDYTSMKQKQDVRGKNINVNSEKKLENSDQSRRLNV